MTLMNIEGKPVQPVPLRRCVVNYADGGPDHTYYKGQLRLGSILRSSGIPFLSYTIVPGDFPPHQIVPYAFKPACVDDAFSRGFETVLWMDSSAVPQHDLSPIFEIAEARGAFISANYGHSTGTWATDESLAYFGVTRKQAWDIPHCSALVCAFCIANPVGLALWEEYRKAALAVPSPFLGPHRFSDSDRPDSAGDPRKVEGHRHDQTALSILAWRYGIPLQPNKVDAKNPVAFLDYGKDQPHAIVAAYPAD